MCKEHTDVNDPLLDSWLASVPVIPEAQLHFWALVILKHGHHHCLKWRKEGDKKSRKIRFICLAGTYFFTPARISKNSPSSHVIHHSKSFLSPKLSPVICVELACVFCVFLSSDSFDKENGCKPHHTFLSPCPLLFCFLFCLCHIRQM